MLSAVAWAAPSASVKAEIERLFSYLGSSGCSFKRNGAWHSAADAVQHLRGKYTYLLKNDLITTTESFIERAASRSSLSGRPYLVQCAGTEPVEGGPWFLAELERIRAQPLGVTDSQKRGGDEQPPLPR